jgi:hypothetical protein
VTGRPAQPAGPINSDGYSFLRAGIPAAVLGTYHSNWVDRGFHLPSDNLERVVMARLPEGVEILAQFVQRLDAQPIWVQHLDPEASKEDENQSHAYRSTRREGRARSR